jgi:hypothetical protein
VRRSDAQGMVLVADSAGRYHILMNNAQRATLAAIFARPTASNIRWSEIEALVRALGGVVEERAGSRVWVEVNGKGAVFHRPHPRPEAKKGAVDAVRTLLVNAGIRP